MVEVVVTYESPSTKIKVSYIRGTQVCCIVPTVFSKRQRITLRLLYAMSRPSVVCLSVCDVGAPYSGG